MNYLLGLSATNINNIFKIIWIFPLFYQTLYFINYICFKCKDPMLNVKCKNIHKLDINDDA